uniref:BTB domain-containing protein n=1 Tax=Tetranychus urticae TaxID=32264 RepID=T1KW97_TETUR
MEVMGDASSLLMRAYKNGKWSDVTVMNGDKKYQVHKHILSTSIPYFDKMFSSGLTEASSQVINLDHPPNAFDLIIEWA